MIVWGDLVIRSWNSPTPAGGSHCGDWPMAAGEEGVHIIDISDPTSPDVIGFVDTPCGSHTQTLVPDVENGRLLVYSNSSANTIFGSPRYSPESPPTCRGIDIIEVPLDDPGSAFYLRFEPTGHEDAPPEELHSCHDTGVILGDALKVACSGQTSAIGGNGVTVFSMDPADGGSKEDPMFMYHKTTGGISLGHSASFSWDGRVIIVGHEPGGGSGANCEATDNPLERTFFYVDAETGDSIGQFTIPRPQTNLENCTTHNYDVVPTGQAARDGVRQLPVGHQRDRLHRCQRMRARSPMRIRRRSSTPTRLWASSWAATGPRTGTTGASTSPTSRAGCWIWNLSDPAVQGEEARPPQPPDAGDDVPLQGHGVRTRLALRRSRREGGPRAALLDDHVPLQTHGT